MAFGNWRRDNARVRVRENPGFQLLTKIMQLKGGRIRKAERCLSLSEAKGSNREKWVGETAERCPAGICDGRGAREKFASANLLVTESPPTAGILPPEFWFRGLFSTARLIFQLQL
ncbi:MAG TPA: hypothetical protein DEE98_02055 [Elusimicrobia bacterium]|nr:MAG: hypothetical protein A2278_05855 [Elusimicrobia bacterium RIFOXYA12_FULL_49_49]OGS07782.1 MAG: hypothetical protein A2204_03000 [Elusimicrobia bacterium RIFOXYA1_FULL_47_7]OGS09579.1 MAG: hypothetical protein A2386_07460 [Elusimicrobia bacterium RIFOXYB1_FULL_48_9]OGS15432.1 MAG: hypothetical protein A2251_07685 [Elusimicrobia bacterium RIFOXYA2_FULL_47_53]OGS30860.1 MAG: hypothetical protein A2323_00825 [Elusimicrobia bacterium RIFOXYB2_FULL_46_23]HBU69147.1 hypothetical protein [Elus